MALAAARVSELDGGEGERAPRRRWLNGEALRRRGREFRRTV